MASYLLCLIRVALCLVSLNLALTGITIIISSLLCNPYHPKSMVHGNCSGHCLCKHYWSVIFTSTIIILLGKLPDVFCS